MTPEMKDAFKKYKAEPAVFRKIPSTKIDESRILKSTTSNDQWGDLGINVCHACNRAWAHRVPNLSNTSLEGADMHVLRYPLITRTMLKQLLDDAEYVDPKPQNHCDGRDSCELRH